MDKPVELMRLVRIPPSGKLVVQIGKRRFVSLDEIENPKGKQIILAALGELLTFAGGYEAIVEAGFAPPMTTVEPEAAAVDESEPPAMPSEPNSGLSASSGPVQADEPVQDGDLQAKQAAFLAALERGELAPAANEEVTKAAEPSTTSRGPLSFFNRRSRSAPTEETLVPQLDIAGELNAILQRHIAQDLDLRNQEINIKTAPSGAVQINVNGVVYEEAAEIADPMVRMVIKLATREWEQANS